MSAAALQPGFVEVSKEEFFAFVGPRDVHPRSEREFSAWETRSRTLVGKTTPGYLNPGAPRVYMLTPAAKAAATGSAA